MSDNLSYSLGLDSSKFLSGVDSAQKSLQGLKDSAGGFEFPGVVKMAAGLDVAKAAFSAAAGMIAPVKDKLMEFSGAASAVEKTATALQTFTGSAKLAKNAAEQVAKFAHTPPFGIEESKAAAKALLATGTEVGNLTTEMTILGNIAAGADMPIADLGRSLNKAASMGYVEFESLKQMMERGIPVASALAKEMNVPETAIRKMATEGRISLGNLKAAFNQLGGEGGKFAGVLDRMANDTEGLWASLSGSVDAIYEKLGAPLNDMLRPMLREAIDFVDDMGNKLDIVNQMISDAHEVGKLGELLGDAISVGFGEGINYVAGMFDYASKLAQVFFSGSAEQIDAVFGKGVSLVFSHAFENAGKMVGWLGLLVLTKLTDAFLNVAKTFHAALSIAMDFYIRKWMDFAAFFGVGSGGGEAMTWGQAMNDAGKVFKGMIRDSKAVGKIAKEELIASTDACLTSIKEVVGKTGEILQNGLNLKFEKGSLIDNTEALERLQTAFTKAEKKTEEKKKEEEGKKSNKFEGASSTPQAPVAMQQKPQSLYTKEMQMMDNLAIQTAIGNSQFTKAMTMKSEVQLKQLTDKWLSAGKTQAEAYTLAAEEMKQDARAEQAMTRSNSPKRMAYLQNRERWKKMAGQTDAQKMAREKAEEEDKDYDKMTEVEKSKLRQDARAQIKQNRKQQGQDEESKKNATPQKSPLESCVESIKSTLEEVKSTFSDLVDKLQLA